MKKLATLSLAAAIAVSMAACGSSNTPATTSATPTPAPPVESASTPAPVETEPDTSGAYSDGTYTAEMADFDEKSGWKENISLVVAGGQIVDVDWNSTYKDGGDDKKTASKNGGYDMKVAGAKLDWHEQAELMEQELIKLQDPSAIPVGDDGKTDAVTGVSITVDAFVELAETALSDAK